MRARSIFASSAAMLLFTSLAMGQQPDIVHATLDQTSAAGGLAAAIARATRSDSGPAWIGYAVPAVADGGEGRHGGWGSCSADLEEGSNQTTGSAAEQTAAQRQILIFLRAQRQKIDKIRMFESGCRVDTDGRVVHWLTDVRASESVALLRTQVRADGGDDESHLRGAILAAIASTDDPSADAALQQFTSAASPLALRKDAIFWLGAARGRRGYETLRPIVKSDPSDEIRDKAVFALSINSAPEAVDTLIDVARHDVSPHLRGQALFWLAHKAGAKATGAITRATEEDPDTHVKKQAVFALSQLPPDQGVPLLIQVAQSNRNPEVRKQAFFWLGQSRDPRALDFIARVLTN
jgi:hypothetical protein